MIQKRQVHWTCKDKAGKTLTPTVLVVDDDAECVNFLCRTIGHEYIVTHAINGEEALRKATVLAPDVIVLDIMMIGEMDGVTTFRHLRSDRITCNIPVIMVSNVCQKTGLPFGGDDMEKYFRSAQAAFLEKPVSSEQLLFEVRNILTVGRKARGPNDETGKCANRSSYGIVHDQYKEVPINKKLALLQESGINFTVRSVGNHAVSLSE